ncbi:MAG: histidine--tRNA ligase [Ilumatobacteraceae bacterium]
MPEFQTSPGTRDVLAPDSTRVRRLVTTFSEIVERAGYGEIVPPMFEDLGVFHRLGEATDVVTKEMYDFVDKGGRHIALRPEQTASVVRAFVQHQPLTPWKVWYHGPNFRYEKPQAGRYRQFDQVGVEVLGVDDPYLDVEVIALADRFYRALGLQRVELLLNSLGAPEERAAYVAALQEHFSAHLDALTPESRTTLQKNPLRVLDSKREADAAVIADAPQISAFYSDETAAHFESVCSGLRALSIDFTVSPLLVRGLDYYRKTTFEFAGLTLDSAQNAVGGGGRYDGLAEDLGGSPTPGVGFALGVDRTLMACDAEGVFDAPSLAPSAFVVDTTGGLAALELTALLQSAGLHAERAYDNLSMKSQMKASNRAGATVAVIVGSDELEAGTVTVRPLAGSAGEERIQHVVPRTDLIDTLRKLIEP